KPMWRSRAWLVAAGLLLVVLFALAATGVDPPGSAWAAVFVAVAVAVAVVIWALVRTRSQRRAYEVELAAWAAERATQAERLRIAGELHDVVSHGLGLITVRAAVAQHVPEHDGGGALVSALADIERASRETTTELRRMLDLLRTPGAAPLKPAATLQDLAEIVQAANAAGLTATLDVADLGDVSPGVQLTVCAVVRESLNNTVRHAGPTEARVGIVREGEEIVVDARDAGPRGHWRPQPGAGHGLDGLRERVSVLHGSLRAEPCDPGFQVVVRIPDPEHA
ncbi:MAG: sensor histidine kinase, partial [Pseudoclavibacter sp.]